MNKEDYFKPEIKRDFDPEVKEKLDFCSTKLDKAENLIRSLSNPNVRDEDLVAFEFARGDNNAERSYILVDKTQLKEGFNFEALSDVNHPQYKSATRDLKGVLLVVLEGQEQFCQMFGPDPSLELVFVNEDLTKYMTLLTANVEDTNSNYLVQYKNLNKENAEYCKIHSQTSDKEKCTYYGQTKKQRIIEENGLLKKTDGFYKCYTQKIDPEFYRVRWEWASQHYGLVENFKVSVSEHLLAVDMESPNSAKISAFQHLQFQNNKQFSGLVKSSAKGISLQYGTLAFEQNNEIMEITSKFKNGAPYGYVELVKPNYKFKGLVRDSSKDNKGSSEWFELLYGHIELTFEDPETGEQKTTLTSGLIDPAKGTISTPNYYDFVPFLEDKIFNIDSYITEDFNFQYTKPKGHTTSISIEELQNNEELWMERLHNKKWLRENFIFSTYKDDEHIFHGCMKNYNGQNFGLLHYPSLNQTFVGTFSPKLILESDGVFFYTPEKVEKSKPGDEKERPDPPFRYIGGFKNNLFEGFGILDFSAGEQNLVFEGHFKDGKRDGFGVLRRDGEIVVEGEWENDQFIEEEKEGDGIETSGSFEEFDRKVKESLQQQGKTSKKVKEEDYVDRMSLDFGLWNQPASTFDHTPAMEANLNYFNPRIFLLNHFKTELSKISGFSRFNLPKKAKKWLLPTSVVLYSIGNSYFN